MKSVTQLFVQMAFLGLSIAARAQQGQFEVRLQSRQADCAARLLQVDVEVKAPDAASRFKMGNGNFRFTYNPSVIRAPLLLKQHQFSAASATPSGNYAAQSLNGSVERPGAGIVSLNILYTGGDKGATVVEADWMSVATLQFEVVSPQAKEAIVLRFNDGNTFPVTGLSEVVSKTSNGAFDYDSREVRPTGFFGGLTLPSVAEMCSGTGNDTGGEVQIPEGFSPNGDGLNDLFVIRNLGRLKADVLIFDRAGTAVYSNKEYDNAWDGRTKTGMLAAGTYYYTIKLSDGRKFSRSLTVVR